jgi:seryl-tRNA synthetase
VRGEHGPTPVATLNGTLCAIPRTIVAILETHQQADGSVYVPEALRPYLQGREVLEPVVRD